MNYKRTLALSCLMSFIFGYGYGIIDTLSGFNKIQIILSAFALIVFLIVISKQKDANCVEDANHAIGETEAKDEKSR